MEEMKIDHSLSNFSSNVNSPFISSLNSQSSLPELHCIEKPSCNGHILFVLICILPQEIEERVNNFSHFFESPFSYLPEVSALITGFL